MDTKELGFLAENIAARYLEGQGYEVLERNYRQPWGEIDLITCKADTVVFVEVKANRQEFRGDFDPETRIDSRKLSKITKTAAFYLARWENHAMPWQVDVVSVTFDSAKQKAKIKHFKNVAEDLF